MNSPLEELLKDRVPLYDWDFDASQRGSTYTAITIRGYDNNNKRDFDHAVLKDYLLWFTKFGSVEQQFDMTSHGEKTLYLRGLGRPADEEISFGHPFAEENSDIGMLRTTYPGDLPPEN